MLHKVATKIRAKVHNIQQNNEKLQKLQKLQKTSSQNRIGRIAGRNFSRAKKLLLVAIAKLHKVGFSVNPLQMLQVLKTL